jgi:FkbM family methyltransferase
MSMIRPRFTQQPVVIRKRGGFVWELDLTEGIDFAIFLTGRFETDVQRALRHLVRPGYTVCDIGANIGAHTLALASYVGQTGTVFAFEPTEFAYTKLLRNLSLNPELENVVRPFRVALSHSQDASARASYYSSWPITESRNQLHPIHGGSARSAGGAEIDTLDRVVRHHEPDRLDAIKIDVDGDELDILQGGIETLTRFRPAVVMEYAPYLHANADFDFPKAITDFVRDVGYRMSTLKGRDLPLEPDRLRRLVPQGAGRNILLSPRT